MNDQTENLDANPRIRIVRGSMGGTFLLVERESGADLGTFEGELPEPMWASSNFRVSLMKPRRSHVTGNIVEMSRVNWGSSGAKGIEETMLMANLLATATRIAGEWDDIVKFGA